MLAIYSYFFYFILFKKNIFNYKKTLFLILFTYSWVLIVGHLLNGYEQERMLYTGLSIHLIFWLSIIKIKLNGYNTIVKVTEKHPFFVVKSNEKISFDLLKNKLERQFDAGEITAEKLEWNVAGQYYAWTALWYATLFTGIYAFGGKYKTNARILLALVAGGLVIGAVQKNIQFNKEVQKRKELKNLQNG